MSVEDDQRLQIGRMYGVPMSLIDGRPWVATSEEQGYSGTTAGAWARLTAVLVVLAREIMRPIKRWLR